MKITLNEIRKIIRNILEEETTQQFHERTARIKYNQLLNQVSDANIVSHIAHGANLRGFKFEIDINGNTTKDGRRFLLPTLRNSIINELQDVVESGVHVLARKDMKRFPIYLIKKNNALTLMIKPGVHENNPENIRYIDILPDRNAVDILNLTNVLSLSGEIDL